MKRLMQAWLILVLVTIVGASLNAAITVSVKLEEASGTDWGATAYTSTGTFSIAVGAMGVCFINDSDDDTTIDTFTLTGAGQTAWTQQGSPAVWNTVAAPQNSQRVFVSVGEAGSAASVVVSNGGVNAQTGITIMCYEVAGADVSGAGVLQTLCQGQDATNSQTPGTFATRTANSVLLHSAITLTAATWTREYAASGTETVQSAPTRESNTQWDIGGADVTPTWTVTGNPNGGSCGIEIAVASGGGGGSACRNLATLGAGCN